MRALLFGRIISKNRKRGSSTLEILIATAVLILSLTAVVLVVFSNQGIGIDVQTNNEALYKAQQILEDARALSRQDFSSVVSKTYPPDGDIYTKSLLVSPDLLNPDLLGVTSTVTWKEGTRNLVVNLSTILTNFKNPSGSCSQTLSGNWMDPQHWEFATPDLISPGSGNHSNGLTVSGLTVYRQKLYLTAIDTDNFKNTFYIFDLPSAQNQMPIYDGSLDNSPTVGAGLSALAVSGNYAYVANGYTGSSAGCSQAANCAQLQVIDISDSKLLGNPIKYNLKVPAVASGGNLAAGNSIFYHKNYVYLGLAKTTSTSTNGEFNVIDVHDPLNPVSKGTYKVGNGVNSIYVKDNYAFVASPNSENLTILDISNPDNPFRVGGYTPIGSNNGKTLYAIGSSLYLGRTYGTNEFYIFDSSNLPNISIAGSKDIGSGNDTSINGLTVRSGLAFLLSNLGFQIWDVSSPGSMPSSTYGFIPMSAFISSGNPANAAGTTLNCSGNYFYIALTSPQGNNKDIFSVIAPGAIDPNVAWSNPSDITYGTPLSGTQLNANATAPGTFTYTPFSGTVLSTGLNQVLSVHFVPTDTITYKTVDKIVSINVNQATQTITTTTHAPATAVYNFTFPVAATANSGLTVLITTTGGCSVAGGTVTMTSGVINCVVHYNQAGNINYNAAPEVTETTVASKATPTLSVTNSPVTYDGSAKTASVSGSVAGVVSNRKYNGLATVPINAGTYAITADFIPTDTADFNSLTAASSGNFVINKANQTITFAVLPNKTFGNADFVVSATANSGLAVTFTSQTGSVCTVAGSTVHIVSAGTCTMRASQSGDGNYNAAPNVDRLFNIAKANVTVNSTIYNNVTGNPATSPFITGTKIHDEANITGVAGTFPTGIVDFTLYRNTTCTGSGGNILQTYTGMTLNSGLAKTIPDFTTTAANPNLSFKVHYGGDLNYNAPADTCNH